MIARQCSFSGRSCLPGVDEEQKRTGRDEMKDCKSIRVNEFLFTLLLTDFTPFASILVPWISWSGYLTVVCICECMGARSTNQQQQTKNGGMDGDAYDFFVHTYLLDFKP